MLGLLALVGAGCGGAKAPSSPETSGAARTVALQLANRNIAIKGTISCNGRAPGVIDCTGTTTDKKPISATLAAKTGGTTCSGPLVISVGGTQLVSVADAKCS